MALWCIIDTMWQRLDAELIMITGWPDAAMFAYGQHGGHPTYRCTLWSMVYGAAFIVNESLYLGPWKNVFQVC